MEKKLNIPLVIYRIAGSIEEFSGQLPHEENCEDKDCFCGIVEVRSEIGRHAQEIQKLLQGSKDSL